MVLLTSDEIGEMNTLLNELANATLTIVQSPGPLNDNGDPGTPVTVWEGEARGFLSRQDRDVLSGGVQVRQRTDTFLLFDREAVEVGLAVGAFVAGADHEASTVVISDERLPGPILRRWTVTGMEHEVDNTLDNVTLTLSGDVAVEG